MVTTVLLLLVALPARSQDASTAPFRLSDAEFWEMFTRLSEPDGSFLSENFVSNELSFQEIIPALQRRLTPGGAYLGVGPEQNFTYIANLAPRVAVVFDIRRQNAMLHLMYKAIFELSATRSEFVSRLFSRPAVWGLPREIPVRNLFDSTARAGRSDSAFAANLADIERHLTVAHHFPLPKADLASIEYVYRVFFEAGPDINYGYRAGFPGTVRSSYPTFEMLQVAWNADSVPMAFLATDAHYQAVRDMQRRNAIVPVVGDFAGPKAIRAAGDWLRATHTTVTAFYVSNVEQYLFRDGKAADRFYANVSSLPLDSTSTFIRSVPRSSGMTSSFVGGQANFTNLPPGTSMRFVIRDSAGVRLIQTTQDSAGVMITRTLRDSGPPQPPSPQDTSLAAGLKAMSFRRDSIARASMGWIMNPGPSMAVVMGGLLASGTASMQATLRAFFSEELKSYNAVIAMTKVGRE